ncbi:MAG TPA: hypothetical protein VLI72_04860, partial [Methylibium sp.]|nr:hypothetical protein [Methylibium sp.]
MQDGRGVRPRGGAAGVARAAVWLAGLATAAAVAGADAPAAIAAVATTPDAVKQLHRGTPHD